MGDVVWRRVGHLRAMAYQTSFMWEVIGRDFVQVAKYCFLNEVICRSQSYGIVLLLPKSGGLHDLSNWRPISFLNHDYKTILKPVSKPSEACFELNLWSAWSFDCGQ